MLERMMLRFCPPAIGAALLPLIFLTVAQAAAPLAKTNTPGFYRVMLGDFEVTALLDGTIELPVDKILTGIKPAQVNKTLAKNYLKAPLETSVNAYLINTGEKLVMVDAGTANLFGPTLGKLPANLRAAGYTPEQVDEIYITHLHPDHVGGITVDGKPIFPNAVIRADKHDADSKAAAAQRKKAYAEAAKQGYLVGVAHVSFPGIGRLRAQGSGYQWLPINYATLK